MENAGLAGHEMCWEEECEAPSVVGDIWCFLHQTERNKAEPPPPGG
jgi:hypothetical protein